MLQNAESMKQFEYLEKSLVSFTETVSEHAAELRQVSRRAASPFLSISALPCPQTIPLLLSLPAFAA